MTCTRRKESAWSYVFGARGSEVRIGRQHDRCSLVLPGGHVSFGATPDGEILTQAVDFSAATDGEPSVILTLAAVEAEPSEVYS